MKTRLLATTAALVLLGPPSLLQRWNDSTIVWVRTAASAQEIVTLAKPVTRPATASVRLERLTIDLEQQSVYVQWLGDDGTADSAVYSTPAPQGSKQPTGAALIRTLMTGDHSGTSAVRKMYARLQADGHLPAGSVSGAPK